MKAADTIELFMVNEMASSKMLYSGNGFPIDTISLKIISTPCPVLCTYFNLCKVSAISLFRGTDGCVIIFFSVIPSRNPPGFSITILSG